MERTDVIKSGFQFSSVGVHLSAGVSCHEKNSIGGIVKQESFERADNGPFEVVMCMTIKRVKESNARATSAEMYVHDALIQR